MPVLGFCTYSLHGVVCIKSVKEKLASGVQKYDTVSVMRERNTTGTDLSK